MGQKKKRFQRHESFQCLFPTSGKQNLGTLLPFFPWKAATLINCAINTKYLKCLRLILGSKNILIYTLSKFYSNTLNGTDHRGHTVSLNKAQQCQGGILHLCYSADPWKNKASPTKQGKKDWKNNWKQENFQNPVFGQLDVQTSTFYLFLLVRKILIMCLVFNLYHSNLYLSWHSQVAKSILANT